MKKVLLLLSVLANTLVAQNNDSARYNFTLQQAVDYAIKNHYSVKNAILDETISKKKVNEITGLGLPSISGKLDAKNFIDIPTQVMPANAFNPTAPADVFVANQMGIQYQASAGIEVSQLIFSGDYFLGLKASKVFVELSTLNIELSKIELAVLVSKAYYSVLINAERLQLLDANILTVKAAMDGTEGLFKHGFAEKIDWDRLKVSYNNLLVERVKIERLLEIGSYLLKFQMGMHVQEDLALIDKLEDFILDIAQLDSVSSFNYDKRAEYNILETQFKLSKLDLKRHRLAFLPQAFAYGSFSQNAYSPDLDFYKSTQKWYPTSVIGGTITIPIFSGFQQRAIIQQSKLALEKISNQKAFVKRSIDLELASAIASLKNASVALNSQKENIKISQEVSRISKIKFEQGVGSNLEVISANAALKESQINYYNALYDAILSKIDFDKANGNYKY
jgi:outer membrane protein TolC